MANQAGDLRLVNDSNYRGKRNWGWSVWLEGAAVDEGRVKSVTYHLHPTFSNPVHSVANEHTRFKLSGSGWGEFNIKAEVFLDDGQTISLDHWLQFDLEKKRAALKSAKGDIFLSHSTADGPVANRLAALLIAKGYQVTASAMVELSAGADWQNEIRKNIALADLNVVLISSGISEYIGTMISRLLSTDEGIKSKILPVLLGSVEVPELVYNIQALRIGSMNELDKVVDTVENRFNG